MGPVVPGSTAGRCDGRPMGAPGKVRCRHPRSVDPEVAVDVRWISRDGVSPAQAAQIPDLITRDDGLVWAHMNHDDEFGISVLIMTVAPRPDDLREVSSRTPVPRLHMYSDHHFSAINGLVRGVDGLLHFQPLKVFLTQHALWTIFGPATSSLSGVEVNRDIDIVRQQI